MQCHYFIMTRGLLLILGGYAQHTVTVHCISPQRNGWGSTLASPCPTQACPDG